jgi:serine/threonine protein kinase
MTRARAYSRDSRGPASSRSSRVSGRPRDAALPKAGEIIAGKYEVVRTLGEGGMAVVFEALHLRLRQRLAIKVLRPDIPEFSEVLARFEREARATAQLRSVHTARIVDVDTLPNGLPYIVMEYLEGLDLDAALQASGPMPVEQAVDIVLQVTDAMSEAHSLGIVHRDLKPANLFVCRSRSGDRPLMKLLDFGISKITEDDESGRITQAHAYFGTPCYAAPEQLRSAGDADARSDVWSLGIILFELLTGRPPFTGAATAVIARVLSDPIPWPLELRPDLPRDLARVMLQALKRDPAERFQSMREFAQALAPFAPADRSGQSLVRPKGRLGEILVADGLITQADLDRALDVHQKTGVLLGRALIDLGLVAHEDLLAALAKQQGITTPPAAVTTVRPKPSGRDTAGGRAAAKAPARALAKKTLSKSTRHILLALAVAIPLGVLGAIALRSAVTSAVPRPHVRPNTPLTGASADTH